MLVSLIDDVLVYLVHNGVNVILDTEVGDRSQLVIGEYLAARI